jgi:hypothetical protein
VHYAADDSGDHHAASTRAAILSTGAGRSAATAASAAGAIAEVILARAAASLDFDKPVDIAILQNIPEDARPHDLVAILMAAASPGSYLVVAHPDMVPDCTIGQSTSN